MIFWLALSAFYVGLLSLSVAAYAPGPVDKKEEARKIAAIFADWLLDPVQFVRDMFGVEPDAWQADVLRNFLTNQRLAMRASKGPGKSTVLAWLAWYFLATRPMSRVFATSISKENLADGLWAEMSKWYGRSKLLKKMFEVGKTRISNRALPGDWYMAARTWSRSANKEQQGLTLAGLHSDYQLFLIDEAGGIPDAVAATAEAGLATGIEVKLVIAGNPTHLEGPLWRACTLESELWWVKTVCADPSLPIGHPRLSPRVSRQWALEQIKKFTKDNPWVLVNVFGEFPPSSINALLGPDEVDRAMARHITKDVYSWSQKRLGVDVARFGDDETILFPRWGLAGFKCAEMRNAKTHEIAARCLVARKRFGAELIFVDDTGGWGAGVIDALNQAGAPVIPINFSGKATDPRFFNKRSEIIFLMAEWVKSGGCLPPDPVLKKELTTPTYTLDQGKLRVEEKEHIKDRLGFSPDRSDALALTFAYPEAPASDTAWANTGRQTTIHDYDPLADGSPASA